MTVVYADEPNLVNGRFVYTEDDLQAVVDLVTEQGINYNADDVRALLSMRTGRDITLSAAKNVLTRLRQAGRIPSKTPDRVQAGGRKKKKASPVAKAPAPKKPKKFDPHMTADDLFDFNVQVIYAELDNMPVRHLSALLDFRKACEKLIGALTDE